jgi:hypothetical protein
MGKKQKSPMTPGARSMNDEIEYVLRTILHLYDKEYENICMYRTKLQKVKPDCLTENDKRQLIFIQEHSKKFKQCKTPALKYLDWLLKKYPKLCHTVVGNLIQNTHIVSDMQACNLKIGPNSNDTAWADTQTEIEIEKIINNPPRGLMSSVDINEQFDRISDKPRTKFTSYEMTNKQHVVLTTLVQLERWSESYGSDKIRNNSAAASNAGLEAEMSRLRHDDVSGSEAGGAAVGGLLRNSLAHQTLALQADKVCFPSIRCICPHCFASFSLLLLLRSL